MKISNGLFFFTTCVDGLEVISGRITGGKGSFDIGTLEIVDALSVPSVVVDEEDEKVCFTADSGIVVVLRNDWLFGDIEEVRFCAV